MNSRSWQPHVTVACVIPRQGRFLMVEELINGEPVLNQPAGHLEASETLLQAAQRETLEETAWQVKLISLVGIYLWQKDSRQSFLRFCYHGEPELLLPKNIDPAIKATHWLSYDDIIKNQHRLRSPLVLRCIEDYKMGVTHPLDLLHYMD